MKYLGFFAICLVIQGFGTAFCVTVQDANKYVDYVLRPDGPNGTSNLASVEPVVLNEFQTEFSTKLLLVNSHGTVRYQRGQLYGLGDVVRKGNCSLPTLNSKGEKVRFNCTLLFPRLHAVYRGNMKVGVTPTVEIKAKVNVTSLSVVLELKQHINKPYSKPKVDDFEVDENSINIHTEFRGLGPANAQLHVLRSDFEKHFKKDVEHFIENGLGPLIQCFLLSAGPLPRP